MMAKTREERDLKRRALRNRSAIRIMLLQIVRQINPEWADKLEKADKILGYIAIAIIAIGFIAIVSLH